MPWKLPPSETPQDQLSDEAFLEWSTESRPLLRAWGWRDSALFHPDTMNTQYLRFQLSRGRLPVKPYLIMYLCALGLGAVIGGIIVLARLFEGSDPDPTRDLGVLPTWLLLTIGAVSGTLFGSGLGVSTKSLIQFRQCYAPARIIQVATVEGVRRAVAILETALYRPVFAGRTAPDGASWWRGQDGSNGYADGSLSLEVDGDQVDLFQLTDPKILYDEKVATPAGSTFNNTHSASRFSMNSLASEAGDTSRMKHLQGTGQAGFGNWAKEHKGIVFFIICAIISGVGLILGIEAADVKSIGDIASGS